MTLPARPISRHRLPLALAVAAALASGLAGATTMIQLQPQQAQAPATATGAWSATLAGGESPGLAPSFLIRQDETAAIARDSAPWPDYGRDPATAAALAPGRLEIRLQHGHYDPLVEAAPILPALAGATHGDGARDYRLLQFIGPIREEWQKELTDQGLEIIDYVPDFAYIVRGAPTAFAALGDWPMLRWSGPFLPAHRLAAGLVPAAMQPSAQGEADYLVRGFRGEAAAALARAIGATGARILEQAADNGDGVIARVRAPQAALLALASIRAVAWIEAAPRWRLTNNIARSNQILGKDYVEQAHGYYGAGQIAAVTDTGLSTGNPASLHADFSGRVLAAAIGGTCNDFVDRDGHGTHVAGSVLGSGARSGSNPGAGQYAGTAAGIAPQAGLVVWAVCSDFSNLPSATIYADLWQLLYNYDPRLRVSNNSWGSSDPSTHGRYNTPARETDRFMRDRQDMVIVFSAGNDGIDADWDGVNDMTTTAPPSTAKNVISVGMGENYRASGGYNPGGPCAYWGECWPDKFPVPPLQIDRISDNPYGMSAISGRGPTLSGRLKPDIFAPGSNILSARSEAAPPEAGWGSPYNQYYTYMGGTSMSGPLVAGGTVIMREFFTRAVNYPTPSSALVKAALINQALDTSPGQYGSGPQQDVWRRPDVNQGWGRMNLPFATSFEQTRWPTYYDFSPGLATGQVGEVPVQVRAGGSRLRVTMAWTDVAGLEASHGALVNDLDLELVAPNGATFLGYAGISGGGADHFNNYEEVDVPGAMAGTWLVRVRGYNVPSGPQPFAMVVMGDLVADVIFRHGFEQ